MATNGYLPSQEEIKEATQRIKAAWESQQRRKRKMPQHSGEVKNPLPYTPPIYPQTIFGQYIVPDRDVFP